MAATLVLAWVTQAADPADLPEGVRRGSYMGWNNALYIEADDVNYLTVVVPEIGGRIAFYGHGAENIIYENRASAGKILGRAKEPFTVGGYQLDIGPELRGIPEHQNLWMGPYSWTAPRDHNVVVTSDADKSLGVRLEKSITFDPEKGDVGLVQRLINAGTEDIRHCLWDRTLCVGGGYAIIPLAKKSRFPAKWSLRRPVGDEGKYTYDGANPAADNVHVFDNVLVAKAGGTPMKLGADSDAGWLAYTAGRLLLIKYFPYESKGNYTDGGNSVEFYTDAQVAELEPLSPEVTVKPGENYAFPEKWSLIVLNEPVKSFEEARALVKKITPFKFK